MTIESVTPFTPKQRPPKARPPRRRMQIDELDAHDSLNRHVAQANGIVHAVRVALLSEHEFVRPYLKDALWGAEDCFEKIGAAVEKLNKARMERAKEGQP